MFASRRGIRISDLNMFRPLSWQDSSLLDLKTSPHPL
jgi:hypothetical protein